MKKLPAVSLILLMATIIASQFGCSKGSSGSYGGGGTTPPPATTNCTGINPSFSADVLPLIQTKCAINSDCHATGTTNSGGAFTNYAQISAKASNIKSQVSAGTMPKTGSLTTA